MHAMQAPDLHQMEAEVNFSWVGMTKTTTPFRVLNAHRPFTTMRNSAPNAGTF